MNWLYAPYLPSWADEYGVHGRKQIKKSGKKCELKKTNCISKLTTTEFLTLKYLESPYLYLFLYLEIHISLKFKQVLFQCSEFQNAMCFFLCVSRTISRQGITKWLFIDILAQRYSFFLSFFLNRACPDKAARSLTGYKTGWDEDLMNTVQQDERFVQDSGCVYVHEDDAGCQNFLTPPKDETVRAEVL